MNLKEWQNIIVAIIILTIIAGFSEAIAGNWSFLAKAFLFSIIIILVYVFSKKLMASMLDSGVEHRVWGMTRFGLRLHWRLKEEIPMGIILPLLFSLFSIGYIKLCAILTYETTALKSRASMRFGPRSLSTITDWHNGIIGASGILSLLVLSAISYFLPWNLEFLAKIAAYYALANMIPFSNLDGTQILFGSKILWTTLAALSIIFAVYAFILV